MAGRKKNPDEDTKRREPAPPPFPLELPELETWAALHTHPRAEKVVARFFAAKGIGFYLPMSLTRRTYEGRVRTSWIPLLPGYLFFDARVTDRSLVYGSRRVAKVLRPDDPIQLHEDLSNLSRAALARPTFEPAEIGPPGTRVEVIAGPLQGVVGEYVRRQGRSGLILRVGFLHQAVEVAIDRELVRPVDAER